MKMSAQQELEKLQAMRAELEAESRSLKEQQNNLENNVTSLKEKIATEELQKEKAAIEELKNRNKAAKDTIAELEAKKKKLETKLDEITEKPVAATGEDESGEKQEQPEAAEEASDQTEADPEEPVFTMRVVESEDLVEAQEEQQGKKRRFF